MLQLLLVFSAFTIMVVMSNSYASRIVNKHISNYGDEVITASAETIKTYLQGHEITLNDMAFVIEGLRAQGSDAGAMQAELILWSDWLFENDDRFESVLFLYGYVDGTLINNAGWDYPEGFDPQTRVWYTGAYENSGTIFYSDPYLDAYTGEFVMTISRQVFSPDGEPFGVVALDVFVSSISNYIGNLQLMNSGYAVLMDSNRRIIIHPVADVLGLQIESVTGGSGYDEIAGLLKAGEDISAYNYSAIRGANDVAFFKKLFNGWYLELSLSSKVYYKDVDDMRLSLSVTGGALALLVGGVLTVMHIARRRADEANRMKTSFLAKMSHEIRTPMNAVIGMTELMLHEPLSERQTGYIEDIRTSASSLLSLINDIPDISGGESGALHAGFAGSVGAGGADNTLYAPSVKILLVDDNDFNLKVAHGLLMLFGVDAQTAGSGREAVAMVCDNDYDLVFMDHMMPGMDGVEAAGEIRKLGGKYRSLPVIALTANAVQGAREMFLANGFNDYISKPIDIQELAGILVEWLPPYKVTRSACAGCAGPAEKTADDSSAADGSAEMAADHYAADGFTEKPAVFQAISEPASSAPVKGGGEGLDGSLEIAGRIEEINVEVGLSHLAGMESLYIETLLSFREKLIQESNNMSGALDGGDISGFSISVHAMKSSLATIGAMGLSEEARKLEMASKEKDAGYCAEEFPGFNEKLLSLHKALSALPGGRAYAGRDPGESSGGYSPDGRSTMGYDSTEYRSGEEGRPQGPETGDPEFLREQVEKALAASEDYDNDAGMDAINSLLTRDYGGSVGALLTAASEAFQAYDYETAGNVLRKL